MEPIGLSVHQSFEAKCHVQKACHQQVANAQIICVAACYGTHSLCVKSFFWFFTVLHGVTCTIVKCADLAGRYDIVSVPEEESLQFNVQHAFQPQPASNSADAHHLCSAQSSEATLTMLLRLL